MDFKNRLAKALLLLFSFALFSCVSVDIEKAFKGELEGTKNNEVIADYCVTCHLHKDFDPDAHLFDVKYRYENPKYAGKGECASCHEYDKTWLLDIRRKTHRPMADL